MRPHRDQQTLTPPDYMGWRLHPKGIDQGEGLQDRDPRGREHQNGKFREEDRGTEENKPSWAAAPCRYVELHCHTCYSFREGASTPRQLLARAAGLGYRELAITDRDGLYGAMEFARAAKVVGIRPIIGADVTLQGGYRLVLLAETREGYANLCQLLSEARLAEARRASGDGGWDIGVRPEVPNPQISLQMLAQHTRGLIALSGDEHGEVPSLIAAGQWNRALAAARR